MKTFDRPTLEERKADLQKAQAAAYEEYQQITGAIRLLEVLLEELDRPVAQASEAGEPPAEGA